VAGGSDRNVVATSNRARPVDNRLAMAAGQRGRSHREPGVPGTRSTGRPSGSPLCVHATMRPSGTSSV
jgi:hypothetical protein